MGLPAQTSTLDKRGVTASEGLQRRLQNRHIQMIALGGAIGVGLFLASGGAIHRTGPSLLISYAVGGLIVFLILRALGELALYKPISGSFTSYATELINPLTGYITGWTYWITYIVAGMAEMTAIGIYAQYWIPGVPQWVITCSVLGLILFANLLSVRIFGECEFWFAIIKVTAIIAMIIVGIGVLVFGFSSLADQASVSNLWNRGVFPNGFSEMIMAFQVVIFSFFGLEMLGVAAGETENPERTLPTAINRVVLRIIIFYIGSLAVIMMLVAWDRIDPHGSPFVIVFDQLGIPGAASIVNFVVVTAALSTGNSALFVTGRMLFSLSEQKLAPACLARLNRKYIPSSAVLVSAAGMFAGVVLNYLVPEKAFIYIASIATVGAIWTWGVIITSHLCYHRSVDRGDRSSIGFRMPLAPWSDVFALIFLVGVAVIVAIDPTTRVAFYVAGVWVAGLLAAYYARLRLRARLSARVFEPASQTASAD